MNRTFLAAALAAVALCAHAKTLTVPAFGLSFDAPDGFKPVPADLVAAKWKEPPAFVVGTERATTTIAVDLKTTAVRPDQVPEMEKAMEGMMPRLMPGLQWIRHDMVTLNGRPWAELEMTTVAHDTGIHNILLATSWQGRMLILNFNSTTGEFPTYEAALRKSIESVRITGP